jgi:hypothetical protein
MTWRLAKKIIFIFIWGRYSPFVFLTNAEHTLKIIKRTKHTVLELDIQ